MGDQIAAKRIKGGLVFWIVADKVPNTNNELTQPFREFFNLRRFAGSQQVRSRIIVAIDNDGFFGEPITPFIVRNVMSISENIPVTKIRRQPHNGRLKDKLSRPALFRCSAK